MPDEFDDALDRLDVTFSDFVTGEDITDVLGQILGQFVPGTDRGALSPEQLEIATRRIQLDKQRAFALDVNVTRFRRGGQQVTQLRDRFGRFVTSGARNIRDYLGRPPY